MSNTHYSTKIVGIGSEVPRFFNAIRYLVLFEDSLVLPELRDFSVLHSGNKLNADIKQGDVLKLAGEEYTVIKVGEDVASNIRTLGHIIIKFDGGEGELLAGSIHVENKPLDLAKIESGSELAFCEASVELLNGCKVAIKGVGGEFSKKFTQLMLDNGAEIVGEESADVVATVKVK